MANLNILVVSSSLNPQSRSRVLAKMLVKEVTTKSGADISLLDLQNCSLPMCDGGSVYGLPEVVNTKALVEAADAIVFASPIYTYGLNASMKNFVELFGHSMVGKVAGFICAAGGGKSYMSVMGFANSLMLDFRMIILPRFVYVDPNDWVESELNPAVRERLVQFSDEFFDLASKLTS